MADTPTDLHRRITAAAIIGGHRGLQGLAQAIDPRLNITARKLRIINDRSPHLHDTLQSIAEVCNVPYAWLRDGWSDAEIAPGDQDPAEEIDAVIRRLRDIQGLID